MSGLLPREKAQAAGLVWIFQRPARLPAVPIATATNAAGAGASKQMHIINVII